MSRGATLITTSVFATVVSDSATTKAVNITAHIAPENKRGAIEDTLFLFGENQYQSNKGCRHQAAPEHLLERRGALDLARDDARGAPQHRGEEHQGYRLCVRNGASASPV